MASRVRKKNSKLRPRKKSTISLTMFLVICILAVTAGGFYLLIENKKNNFYLDYETATQLVQLPKISTGNGLDKTKPETAPDSQTRNESDTSSTINLKDTAAADSKNSREISEKLTESEPINAIVSKTDESISQTTISTPAEAVETLQRFYSHLDQQTYIRDFALETTSAQHFSILIQKLLDNPPTVTREADNLFTLLSNTAHFFRILGKNNILLLKGILDRNRSSLEEMLEAFFILTTDPKLLKDEFAINLNSDALYDYSCFLLHTMGGRLYLFRRDSTSRMVVTYYAIKVIDRANNEGNGRHGIDIRPSIKALIEEIENGGLKLKNKEVYLNRLYDLQEKYDVSCLPFPTIKAA